MAVIGLIGLVAAFALGLAFAGRILYVGALDARDLGTKLATPRPRSAGDWPELTLESVVPDPSARDQVVLVAQWPAHPERRSVVVLALSAAAVRRLEAWRDQQAALSPLRLDDGRLSLRRRQSTEAVAGRVVAETPWVPRRRPRRLNLPGD